MQQWYLGGVWREKGSADYEMSLSILIAVIGALK